MRNPSTPYSTKAALARMQTVHLGKIFFRFQFLAIALLVASVLSFLATAIYYVFLIAISLLTLFAIYALYPGFVRFWSGGEKLAKIAEALGRSQKYVAPVAIALGALAILLLCLDRRQKHIAEIIVSAMCMLVATIALIVPHL